MAIEKMMDLSTAHLTPATREWMDQRDAEAARRAYGWFMHVPDDATPGSVPDSKFAYPDDLWGVFIYARKNDCPYVLFDADGDHIVDLPAWDDDGRADDLEYFETSPEWEIHHDYEGYYLVAPLELRDSGGFDPQSVSLGNDGRAHFTTWDYANEFHIERGGEPIRRSD